MPCLYLHVIVLMQVRAKLQERQQALERSLKAKKLRELKKYGKKVRFQEFIPFCAHSQSILIFIVLLEYFEQSTFWKYHSPLPVYSLKVQVHLKCILIARFCVHACTHSHPQVSLYCRVCTLCCQSQVLQRSVCLCRNDKQ